MYIVVNNISQTNNDDTIFSKTRFVNLPDRNTAFIPSKHKNSKNSYIEQLHIKLNDKNQYSKKMITIVGLGGIGKTQLAIEYAYKFSALYDFVCWIDAENMSSIINSYRNLLTAINVKFSKQDSPKKIISLVKNKLQNRTNSWLLIFDNVENYKSIQNKTPQKGGHLIITSRNLDWKTKIKLDVFQQNEALEYLFKITSIIKNHTSNKMAIKICKKLGYLPLALAQTAAYICKEKINFKEYLQLYKKNTKPMLNTKLFSEEYYNEVVATTWNITINKLKQQNKLISIVMNRCAFLIADNILLKFFDDDRLNKKLIKDAIALLVEYSMLKKQGNIIMIHKLVQKVTQINLTKQLQIETIIALLTLSKSGTNLKKNLYLFDDTNKSTINLLTALAPHTLLLIQHIDELKSTNKFLQKHNCILRLRIASFLNRCGRAPEAERLLLGSIRIAEEFNIHDRLKDPSVYKNLFNSYLEQKKYKQALELVNKKIKEGKMSIFDKAVVLHNMKRFTDAETEYLQFILALKNVKGYLHTKALAYRNLGNLYFEIKKYNEASSFLLDALAIYRKTSQTLDIAQTAYKLGVIYNTIFELLLARKYFTLAIEKFAQLGKPYIPQKQACQKKLYHTIKLISEQQVLLLTCKKTANNIPKNRAAKI